MRPVRSGGGFAAIAYTLRLAAAVGPLRLWRAMRSRNACKACALGMGGASGGMRNEIGHFPELCKKSLQAMAADMRGAIPEQFFAANSIARLRAMSPRELEAAGRLTFPVIAEPGATHYRPVAWDDALARVARTLREANPLETFWYFSGRSSNEAAFLLQLFARIYGTNHVNNCSYYCHQASGVGLMGSIGGATSSVDLEDVEHCDLFVLLGGNPASNHPRLMSMLMRLRRRGGHVIVVNPVREPGLVRFRVPSDPWSLMFGTRIASQYVQPHIGGDIAFMTGMAKRLVEIGAVDAAFRESATEGWDELRAQIERATWDDIVAASGVTRVQIERAADLYAKSRAAIFGWTMGITHHAHGVENVQWIANLALMRGMIGRPHAGLLPIRGHSNVQGIGTMGVTPTLRRAVFERFREHGLAPPDAPGLDTMGCVEAAARGEMRAAVCLGGNLFGSNPDADFARRAMARIGLVTYLNTSLNTGHAHGMGETTIILPVAARDEEEQPTTQESMFNFVRLSEGGLRRFEGPRPEVSIVADLAHRVMGDRSPISFADLADHANIRAWIAKLIPGMEAIADIERTGAEFTIPGRVLHAPTFATSTGRAKFHAHPIPRSDDDGGRIRLMSVRSEGQFNTIVYEDEDIYRGQERRDVILMNARDLERLGIAPDAPVRVTSDTGEMRGLVARAFEVRAGNALAYYPECNVLIGRAVDPASRTPAFKSTWVRVIPM